MKNSKNKHCHFIAVVSDMEAQFGALPAIRVLKYRLNNHVWGLNEGTHNKQDLLGDSRLVFYLGGRHLHSQSFVATALVDKVHNNFPRFELPKFVDESKWYYTIPSQKVDLKNIEWFENPLKIKDVLAKMAYFKHKDQNKWWFSLQGGLRKIAKSDYDLIKAESSKMI